MSWRYCIILYFEIQITKVPLFLSFIEVSIFSCIVSRFWVSLFSKCSIALNKLKNIYQYAYSLKFIFVFCFLGSTLKSFFSILVIVSFGSILNFAEFSDKFEWFWIDVIALGILGFDTLLTI